MRLPNLQPIRQISNPLPLLPKYADIFLPPRHLPEEPRAQRTLSIPLRQHNPILALPPRQPPVLDAPLHVNLNQQLRILPHPAHDSLLGRARRAVHVVPAHGFEPTRRDDGGPKSKVRAVQYRGRDVALLWRDGLEEGGGIEFDGVALVGTDEVLGGGGALQAQ